MYYTCLPNPGIVYTSETFEHLHISSNVLDESVTSALASQTWQVNDTKTEFVQVYFYVYLIKVDWEVSTTKVLHNNKVSCCLKLMLDISCDINVIHCDQISKSHLYHM